MSSPWVVSPDYCLSPEKWESDYDKSEVEVEK